MAASGANATPRGLRTRLYFWRRRRRLTRRFQRVLRGERDAMRRHGDASKAIYETYGDRELKTYEHGICTALVEGRLCRIPYREVRDAYLAPVEEAIADMLRGRTPPLRVLEIGCGNATNLKLLRERFADKVALAGIDIAAARLEEGRAHWAAALDGVEMRPASATALDLYDDGSFDIVFSVCALEQIPYRLHEAVGEMVRVSRAMVICVEPVFEFGNPAQRLYNIVADQCRTLLPELSAHGLAVEPKGLMPILHNPLNPVGLIVARKAPAA